MDNILLVDFVVIAIIAVSMFEIYAIWRSAR